MTSLCSDFMATHSFPSALSGMYGHVGDLLAHYHIGVRFSNRHVGGLPYSTFNHQPSQHWACLSGTACLSRMHGGVPWINKAWPSLHPSSLTHLQVHLEPWFLISYLRQWEEQSTTLVPHKINRGTASWHHCSPGNGGHSRGMERQTTSIRRICW